jgi:hypothetical protein
MSGLRFKVGDLAVIAVVRNPTFQHLLGRQVTITGIHTRTIYDTYEDYRLDFFNGNHHACCMDWQLRKLDPPAEPASLTRESDVEVTA